MYLKRLEIQGFKSFASKTVLDFLAPKNNRHSVTGVVGPNGSGKSNITDAMRWVMGETSLKNLRGKKSEDVIFSGSEQKGALGAAEVTMVLDNLDASGQAKEINLGVDLPLTDTSSITITRRIYRDGEAEYLVNNNPARLLDIHLLFAKLQFAQHAYSIVSQGMIDKLLIAGPNERKDFFDEACGIKEFQIKEHQAELKLARTRENMQQAEVLIAEVEPRLRLLSRQVKKLEKRHEVETKLRAVAEDYYSIIYSNNNSELNSLRQKLGETEKKYRAAFNNLTITQEELAQLAHAKGRQGAFEELQAKYQEARRVEQAEERRLTIIEGQMQTEYRASGSHNISWLENKLVEIRALEAKHKTEFNLAEEDSKRAEEALGEERALIEKMQRGVTENKVKLSRLQSELLKDQSEQNYREYSGLAAVKAILDAREKFGKVHGVLSMLGEVEETYSLALEVAAGAHLSSLVIDNEETARLAIEYLRSHRFGVATFLPLSKIQPGFRDQELDTFVGLPGVVGKATSLVRFDKKFQNIFDFVFGGTLIVENLQVAERIGVGRCRMVTLDGDVVERKGVMRGGFRTRRQGMSFSQNIGISDSERTSELNAQINLANHVVSELETKLEQEKSKLVNVSVEAQSALERVKMRSVEHEASLQELNRLEHELKLLTASPDEYSLQLKNLQTEKLAINSSVEAARASVAKIEKEIEEFNAKEEAKQRRVFALQEKMQSEQHQVNEIVGERSNINIELAKTETKREDLAREVQAELKMSLPILAEIKPRSNYDDLPKLAANIERLKYQLSLIGGIDEEVIAEHATTKERYDFLTTQLKDLRAAVEDLEEMIAELNDLMKKKRGTAFKQIRKEFDRYFKILFEGGSANLEEVYGEVSSDDETPSSSPFAKGEGAMSSVGEANDPLSFAKERVGGEVSQKREKILTGIDVIANPPGKKIKHLNSLSGGERTLTSIALICAILHTNPSPFVVLDEVEAALDEANTLRFTKILQELSTRSQFIIVTHNRVTMHAADALYGVVMQGDGVSKLLSVKIEEVGQYEDSRPVGKVGG